MRFRRKCVDCGHFEVSHADRGDGCCTAYVDLVEFQVVAHNVGRDGLRFERYVVAHELATGERVDLAECPCVAFVRG